MGVSEAFTFAATDLVGVCGSSLDVFSGGNVNDVAAAFLFLLCGFTGYGVRRGFLLCKLFSVHPHSASIKSLCSAFQ